MKNSQPGTNPLHHPRLHWAVFGVVALAVAITGLQTKLSSHAATPNSLYTSSVSKTPLGSDFTVAIRLNSDAEPINAVSSEISFPADKLEFVSADVVGAAFTNVIETTSANGHLKLVVSTPGGTPPVAGDNLVANLTFRPLAQGGSTLTVDSSSLAVSSVSNTNILTTYTGNTVTVTKGKGGGGGKGHK